MDDEMMKAQNKLHAIARSFCDPDVKSSARMIGYLSEPIAQSSGTMLHELRGEKNMIKYYSGWAHWEFLAAVSLENTNTCLRVLAIEHSHNFGCARRNPCEGSLLITRSCHL